MYLDFCLFKITVVCAGFSLLLGWESSPSQGGDGAPEPHFVSYVLDVWMDGADPPPMGVVLSPF